MIWLAVKALVEKGGTPQEILTLVKAMEGNLLGLVASLEARDILAVQRYERERKKRYRDNDVPDIKEKNQKKNIYNITNPEGGAGGNQPADDALNNPLSMLVQFEEFWLAYPKKAAKGAARRAYLRARRDGTGHPEIMAAVARYRPEKGFEKHPATWLNGQCWLDEGAQIIPLRPGPKRTWAEIKAEREAKREAGDDTQD